MPTAALRPCTQPGCGVLCDRGRCDKHRRQYDRKQAQEKPSQQPGYRIRGRKGQEIRAAHLSSEPLCRACMAKGIVQVAHEVDHIRPLSAGGDDTERNKQSLCRPCHTHKTMLELGYSAAGTETFGMPRWALAERSPRWHEQRRNIGALLHPTTLRPATVPLTIVCGPAGAGKSTYIAQHAAPGDTVIDMDLIRVELGIGIKEWNKGTLVRCMTRRNAMLASLAHAGAGEAWFIVGAATAAERAWWRRMLQPERVVIVLASLEACVTRIQATRTADRAERSIKAARKWWATYSHAAGEIEIRTDA